jgi:hypothetical protein
MHTYQMTVLPSDTKKGLWVVYFVTSQGRYPVRELDSERGAAAFTSYLNGGDHPEKPWPEEA